MRKLANYASYSNWEIKLIEWTLRFDLRYYHTRDLFASEKVLTYQNATIFMRKKIYNRIRNSYIQWYQTLRGQSLGVWGLLRCRILRVGFLRQDKTSNEGISWGGVITHRRKFLKGDLFWGVSRVILFLQKGRAIPGEGEEHMP